VGSSGQVLTSNGAGALPTFQTISTKAFPTGTRMSFQQTAAPTGWTKDTTAAIDNSAMRLVTGSVVNGGSVNFTTAFASQTPSGTVSVSGSAGATTLTTPQIPSHNHNLLFFNASGDAVLNTSNFIARAVAGGAAFSKSTQDAANTTTIASTGGGGSHNHPLTISSSTFTGSAINLAVKYYDFIIATID
jgi:hypothetical protein